MGFLGALNSNSPCKMQMRFKSHLYVLLHKNNVGDFPLQILLQEYFQMFAESSKKFCPIKLIIYLYCKRSKKGMIERVSESEAYYKKLT